MARKFALVERESEEESSSEEEEEEEEDVEEAHVARKGPVPRGQQNVVPSTAGTSQDQQEERGVPVPSRIKIKMKGGPAGSAPGCKVSDLRGSSGGRPRDGHVLPPASGCLLCLCRIIVPLPHTAPS